MLLTPSVNATHHICLVLFRRGTGAQNFTGADCGYVEDAKRIVLKDSNEDALKMP
jgi:hypothetical protein